MAALADAGQTVVASIMGLGAAGVAGGVVAMTWSLHLHQLQLGARPARREAGGEAGAAESMVPAMNGNGHAMTAAASSAIEGPDSVIIGEQARYQVRRTGAQQVVSWTAGGGTVSQAADPVHPDDLLLVAERPGSLTVSVRLREGLAERRETKAVTAVPNPETTVPAVASRVLLQEWPLITVAVLVVGFTAALTAVGSIPVSDFIALVAPLIAVLAVVAATRGTGARR
jgi:hypothetical protein